MTRKKWYTSELVKSSQFLLRVRLWFFSAAWVHLIIAALVLLRIDMSGDEDPKVRKYDTLKWRLITMWFNLINLAYIPLCIYCDWREKRRDGELHHVQICRQLRDVIFTSIVFPTIMFADILFWRLYHTDLTLINPVALLNHLPDWGQHSLHTVSLVVAILDLLLVPRSIPENLKPRWTIMITFYLVYHSVVLESYLKGDMVYGFLETYSVFNILLFCCMSFIEYVFYFTLQWLILDLVWGVRRDSGSVASVKMK